MNLPSLRDEAVVSQTIDIKPDVSKVYTLKINAFDPSTGSPPNTFLQKLNRRVNKYYSPVIFNNSDVFKTK